MKVQKLMSAPARSCTPETDLAAAAMMMWENDCGAIAVVDGATRKALGVITDRDICMAVTLGGCSPGERRVSQAMSRLLFCVKPDDDVNVAVELMKANQVRRLPVVDESGGALGMISMNDIVLAVNEAEGRHEGTSAENVVRALAAICRHRGVRAESPGVAVF